MDTERGEGGAVVDRDGLRHAHGDGLRRTFALDVLACPDCGGRLRLVATIADPRVIARILAHLGLPLELSRSTWSTAAA